jgi:hypothetical protein
VVVDVGVVRVVVVWSAAEGIVLSAPNRDPVDWGGIAESPGPDNMIRLVEPLLEVPVTAPSSAVDGDFSRPSIEDDEF